MWWKKLTVIICLISVLLIGRWVGNYESDRRHATEIANLREQVREADEHKSDELAEQKIELEEQRNEEVEHLTSLYKTEALKSIRQASLNKECLR